MNRKLFYILLILIVGLNITGLFSSVFSGDSALYASISKVFVDTGNYWDIYVNGNDWLDKPHFPFWINAFSMKLFGMNTFAYKLPSLVFFLIALFYTYKLAKSLYNKKTAEIAVLILASSLHIIISNNDVRAESILTALIIGGSYYTYKLILKFTLKDILLTAVFYAAAIMTKGLFVLVIFWSAVFGHLLLKKDLKRIVDYRWILLFLLTFIFILPELYALYIQFDMHPEKVVFGKTNVSGIRFFLWDSQFGRFFNTGPIKGTGNIFFFIHTFLWAFAPWAILGAAGLGKRTYDIFKRNAGFEYITFFGFVIMFIIFSVSSFQLAHYLNILFPFTAILSAYMIIKKSQDKRVFLMFKISSFIYTFSFIFIILLLEYFFKPGISLTSILLISSVVLLIYFVFKFLKTEKVYKVFVLNVLAITVFALYLNLEFYPDLLKYQPGSEAAFELNENHPDKKVYNYAGESLLDYYAENNVIRVYSYNEFRQLITDKDDEVVVYADEQFLNDVKTNETNFSIIKEFKRFHITRLTMNFINYKTRDKTLEKRYLINIVNQ